MKLAVLGAGAVGTSVVELAGDYGHEVVAVADSSSAVVDSSGIDPETVIARKADGGSVGSEDPEAALAADYDVLVEATPTTLGDAEPGFSHVTRALDRDRHVVLANKGPVAERYGDVQAAARDSDGEVRVGPRLVPENGTLAVTGTRNIVQLDTEHAGRLNISGRGAGGPETASAVLADVGRLARR